jgi:hydrogenase nickel incorporation protein HypB
MVGKAFNNLPDGSLDLHFIENVGNLVCPAEFDLGEDYKAVVMSTTEGNDKPVQISVDISEAKVILLNKIDLLPYTNFNLQQFREDLRRLTRRRRCFMYPDAPVKEFLME